MSNQIKQHLVFFDLDDTLLFHGVIREEVREALRAAQAYGHKILLNTGRSKGFLPPVVYEIPWDGMICGTTYVELGGEVLLDRNVPVNLLFETVEYGMQCDVPLCLEGITGVYATVPNEHFINIAPNYRAIVPTLRDISKLTVWRPITEEEAKVLSRRFDLIRHATYTEILPKGFSKGTGIAIVAASEGIPMERTVAFGDSLNDLGMLRTAGFAAVMKNAPAEVHAVADWIATEEETGVAELILQHLLP